MAPALLGWASRCLGEEMRTLLAWDMGLEEEPGDGWGLGWGG